MLVFLSIRPRYARVDGTHLDQTCQSITTLIGMNIYYR